jgi:hypothetical protein
VEKSHFCSNYDCERHGQPVTTFASNLCSRCNEPLALVADFLADPPEWYIQLENDERV